MKPNGGIGNGKSKMLVMISSDWHLRDSTPKCREAGEFQEAQWRKVAWVRELYSELDYPLFLFAGDLFEHWKEEATPQVLFRSNTGMPSLNYIPGNHDLPYHNLKLKYKSGIGVLEQMDVLDSLPKVARIENDFMLHSFPWGVMFHDVTMKREGMKNVAIAHMGVTDSKHQSSLLGWITAKELLKRSHYDLIITGHNHKKFVYEYEGRTLINPGCLTRQSVTERDHEPAVFVWNSESGSIREYLIPIDANVISSSHLNMRNLKSAKRFVDKAKSSEAKVNFKKRLERKLERTLTRREVRDLIWESLEKSKKS